MNDMSAVDFASISLGVEGRTEVPTRTMGPFHIRYREANWQQATTLTRAYCCVQLRPVVGNKVQTFSTRIRIWSQIQGGTGWTASGSAPLSSWPYRCYCVAFNGSFRNDERHSVPKTCGASDDVQRDMPFISVQY